MYTIYDSVTGQILSTASGSSLEVHLADKTYIPGYYTDLTHYIDIATKLPVEKSVKPDGYYAWDPVNKKWNLDLDKTARFARAQRDALLSVIDKVNPVWYASLSQGQQIELGAYRIALLAVPQQIGFPLHVSWPIKPSFL
jgi:hypothetical protein